MAKTSPAKKAAKRAPRKAARPAGHFSPALFRFLRELAANNERTWFTENKHRYESDVRDPILHFISDFATPLHGISKHVIADPRPNGGSMFRIYRDVRFSKDKRPYKTAASAHFRHEQRRDVHSPGFYLHLEPGACFAGVGIYQPDSGTLRLIRDRIVEDPKRWKAVVNRKTFAETWSLMGARLQRPPKGYDPEHPLIETLKQKDFVAGLNLTEREVCDQEFLKQFTRICRAAAPFNRFLAEAIGIPF